MTEMKFYILDVYLNREGEEGYPALFYCAGTLDGSIGVTTCRELASRFEEKDIPKVLERVKACYPKTTFASNPPGCYIGTVLYK